MWFLAIENRTKERQGMNLREKGEASAGLVMHAIYSIQHTVSFISICLYLNNKHPCMFL